MVPKNHNVGISWLLNSSIPTKIGTHRSFWIMLLFQLPSLHHPPQPEVLHLEPWTPKQRVHQRVPWSEIPWAAWTAVVTRAKSVQRSAGLKLQFLGVERNVFNLFWNILVVRKERMFLGVGNDSRFTNFPEIALQHRGSTPCGRVALLICTSQPIWPWFDVTTK